MCIDNQNDGLYILMNEPKFDVWCLDTDFVFSKKCINTLPKNKWPNQLIVHSLDYVGAKQILNLWASVGVFNIHQPFYTNFKVII